MVVYRSVIFYRDREQELAAKKSLKQLQRSRKFDREIVTQIQPAGEYYLADKSISSI